MAQDWATRSTQPGVILAAKLDNGPTAWGHTQFFTQEINTTKGAAGAGGNFQSIYPETYPVVDPAMKVEGQGSAMFHSTPGVGASDILLQFTGPPYTATHEPPAGATWDNVPGLMVPKIQVVQPGLTQVFDAQYASNTYTDGSVGGSGAPYEWWMSFLFRFDQRLEEWFQGGGGGTGGATEVRDGKPYCTIVTASWADGVATITTNIDIFSRTYGQALGVIDGIVPAAYNTGGKAIRLTQVDLRTATYPLVDDPNGVYSAPAYSNTLSAHTNGVSSATIQLQGLPDLSAVVADGTEVMWLQIPNAPGSSDPYTDCRNTTHRYRRWGYVVAKDVTNFTVTLDSEFTIVETKKVAWAIGATLYPPAQGMKICLMHGQDNEYRVSSSATDPAFVIGMYPRMVSDASQAVLLPDAYLGSTAGNTQVWSDHSNDHGSTLFKQYPGGQTYPNGAMRYWGTNIYQPPYFRAYPDQWNALKVHMKIGHWWRAYGLLWNHGGYRYDMDAYQPATSNPFGFRNTNEIYRTSGSYLDDGVTIGTKFGVRYSGATGFYEVTNVTATTLTVTPATLPTIPARGEPGAIGGSLPRLYPAGVVTLTGSGTTAQGQIVLGIPLSDADLIPVSPFNDDNQDGPLTLIAFSSNNTNQTTGTGVVTALSADRRTITFRSTLGTGFPSGITSGQTYSVWADLFVGLQRRWRDSTAQLYWKRPSDPDWVLLFDAKQSGLSNPNIGCDLWTPGELAPYSRYGRVWLSNMMNGLVTHEDTVTLAQPVVTTTSSYQWYDEVLVSTQDIDLPVLPGDTPTPPPQAQIVLGVRAT